MLKPLSIQEMEGLRENVRRIQETLRAGGLPDPTVVNAFVDSVVPRMIATIEDLRMENKRVSDKLADEILDAENIGRLIPEDMAIVVDDNDDDYDLLDPDHSWPVF